MPFGCPIAKALGVGAVCEVALCDHGRITVSTSCPHFRLCSGIPFSKFPAIAGG